jgi:hypothetical protein
MTDEIIRVAYTTPSPAKTGSKQSSNHWKPGQSGNPKGRPKGSKHKATLAAMALMEGDLEIITGKLIEKAKAGEAWAIMFLMSRLVAPARDNPITFKAPKMEKTADLRKALGSVLKAVGKGELTPEEALAVAGVVNGLGLALAVEELEDQIEGLTGRQS